MGKCLTRVLWIFFFPLFSTLVHRWSDRPVEAKNTGHIILKGNNRATKLFQRVTTSASERKDWDNGLPHCTVLGSLVAPWQHTQGPSSMRKGVMVDQLPSGGPRLAASNWHPRQTLQLAPHSSPWVAHVTGGHRMRISYPT